MALTWIPFLLVIQLFSESTCITKPIIQPLCGHLLLKHVFFLVPSSTESSNLAEFLSTVDSAMVLKTPRYERMVQVFSDPKDWEEISEYSKNRGIYSFHTVYCLKKREYSALRKQRLRGSKPGKLTTNEAPNDYSDDDEIEDPEITTVKNSLEGLNGEAWKNVRTINTRSVKSTVRNKNRTEAGKSLTTVTQSTTRKIPAIKSNSKTVLRKNTPSPNEASRKSGKQSARSKTQNKSIKRREVENETEFESNTWKENLFPRMKRYSRGLIARNYNDRKLRERRSGNSTWISLEQSGRDKTVSPTSSSRELANTESTTEELSSESNGKTVASRSLEDVGETNTTTDSLPIDVTTETKSGRSGRPGESKATHKPARNAGTEISPEDSTHDDIICSGPKPGVLTKLADRVHDIFNWIKKLASSGSKEYE